LSYPRVCLLWYRGLIGAQTVLHALAHHVQLRIAADLGIFRTCIAVPLTRLQARVRRRLRSTCEQLAREPALGALGPTALLAQYARCAVRRPLAERLS
jgi:hypothetical protein